MKVKVMTVALIAILVGISLIGATQPVWVALVAAVPTVLLSMKIAIAIQRSSE